MDCERFRYLLDAYIDGVLNDEEMRRFMDHADTCEDCRREMREAEMLRDMMKDMDDEIVVPLQAQAAWRNAVRAESKKLRMKRLVRFGYAAAAALALVVGVSFVTNDTNARNAELVQPEMIRAVGVAVETEELIARDGSAATVASVQVDTAIAATKKIQVASCDEACRTLSLLSEEYSGSFGSEPFEDGISCRIELPYEYMSDFLSAASRVGEELHSEVYEDARETAVILIHVCEK